MSLTSHNQVKKLVSRFQHQSGMFLYLLYPLQIGASKIPTDLTVSFDCGVHCSESVYLKKFHPPCFTLNSHGFKGITVCNHIMTTSIIVSSYKDIFFSCLLAIVL